jgi:membrane protein
VGTVLNVVLRKVLAFGLVLASAILLVISMLSGVVLAAVQAYVPDLPGSDVAWQLVQLAVSLGILSLVFMLLFKYLPETRVTWGDVWIGGVITAVLFTLLVNFSSFYLARGDYQAYGAIGGVMVFLLWIFFSCQVIFLGAEFTHAYAQMFGSHRPKDEARPSDLATAAHVGMASQVLDQPVPGTIREPAHRGATSSPRTAAPRNVPQMAAAAGIGVVAGILTTLLAAVGSLTLGVVGIIRRFRRSG